MYMIMFKMHVTMIKTPTLFPHPPQPHPTPGCKRPKPPGLLINTNTPKNEPLSKKLADKPVFVSASSWALGFGSGRASSFVVL